MNWIKHPHSLVSFLKSLMFLKMPNQANQNKLVAVTRLLLCDFSHFDLLTLFLLNGGKDCSDSLNGSDVINALTATVADGPVTSSQP